MGVRSGKTTSRRRVETYNGFDIVKVKTTHYHKSLWDSGYDSKWIERIETHYDFCREGESNRPSQAYSCWSDNVAKCKECIDKFLKDDSLYFTEAEREKYVYKPNRENQWGFNYNMLMKLMQQHSKADKRMKVLLEDRLTDANFHSARSYLVEGDYEGFEQHAAETCKFNEKFEIYTHTKRKAIKNPEKLAEKIAKVVEEYINTQKDIEDTEVNVKFINDW